MQCPQCGAAYRVGQDMLDQKIECADCHRVFFAKSTAGRRVQKPDYTKAYVGFGIAAVAIVIIFAMTGGKKDDPKQDKPKVEAPKAPQYGRGDHPRALALAEWAKAIGSNSQLILSRHSDLKALAKQLELDSTDKSAVIVGLQQHESTELLRTMNCDVAELDTEQDMTADAGSAKIFVTPKSGDERFKRNTRGIYSVTFKMDEGTPKVTSFKLTMEPIYSPGKNPGVKRYEVNQDIAKADSVTITDSAGTRTVQESKPGPMPHWDGATPQQREM
ncbi:MAG: hypothetical protein KAI24_07805, partial [Planctomycetes bacterium]|nr:hypothetical protein [Planctomycetota bacterium]